MDNSSRKGPSDPKAKSLKVVIPLKKTAKESAKAISAGMTAAERGYFKKLAAMYLTPGETEDNGLEISPNSAPAQVCVRHFKRVLDIDAATHPNGFRVVMLPNLFTPGFVSEPGGNLLPLAGTGRLTGVGNFEVDPVVSLTNIGSSKIVFTDETGRQVVTRFVDITDGAGVARNALPITLTTGNRLTVSYRNNMSLALATPIVSVLAKIAGGNWVQLDAQLAPKGTTIVVNLVLAATYDALAITVGSGNSRYLPFSFELGTAAGQLTMGGATSLNPAFGEQIIDNDVVTGRVISMSVLATNTSSDLYNGGNIACGRVPNRFDPFGNVATQISGLPDNRGYLGPAKTGGYVVWLPSQFDEFEIDNLSKKAVAYDDAEYIVVQVPNWPAGATFRLRFDWIVEFYTPNQIFEKVITPPRTPEFEMFFHFVLSMPAGTCNPDHKDLFRRAIKMARDTYAQIGGHYEKYKPFYDAAASALMMLL
jgi:hypothetical protein